MDVSHRTDDGAEIRDENGVPIAPTPLTPSLGRELRQQLRLALPIIVVQLGMMGMGTVDTMMVGHYGSEDDGGAPLAAVVQGNLLFFGGFTFAMGVMMGLDPVLSQALGADDRRGFARGVQRGFVLVPLLALIASLPLLFAGPLLAALDQPAEVRDLAVSYCHWSLPGVPLMLGFVVLRGALQSLEKLAPILWTVLAANVLNWGLDAALIHGRWGAPELGSTGSAIASTIGRGFMLVMLAALAIGRLRPLVLPLDRAALQIAPLKRLVRLGSSVGAQNLLEFGAFAAVAVGMGQIGTTEQAGHMVAMNLAALSFMIPLGVATAASVRVGKAVGRGDGDAARFAASTALVLGAGFMVASGGIYFLFSEVLAGVYTNKADVVAVAAALLPLAAAFQLFDGVQVVALGVLRGAGDTAVPALVNLVGYWLIGLPFGWWLAFETSVGYPGLWWGLVLSLAVVSAVLVLRIRGRLSRVVTRVDLDR